MGCASTTCGTRQWRCGSRPGQSQEVAARAGHTSVSFTLDRYGHLYPDADQALRDRLDALHALSQARPVGRP
jgi:hypothetical protein